jgi:hypothetical protein
MPDKNLNIRMDPEVFDRLDAESRRTGVSRSQVAETLIEEGLRMQSFPGITFRFGPAGRRAALAGGPDVWEIMRVYLTAGGPKHGLLERTAALLDLHVAHVLTAIAYYSQYRAEVDDWIRRVDEEAEQAMAAWLHGRHADAR